MLIPFLISKIHRAKITKTCLDYEGSISIDEELIEKANLKPFQQVEIYDINNGNRFSTYVITAPRGSKEIGINGAAARLVHPGDLIIIAAYALLDEKEINSSSAIILQVSENNEITKVINARI